MYKLQNPSCPAGRQCLDCLFRLRVFLLFLKKEILYFSHSGKEVFRCPSLKLLLRLKMGLRERERFQGSYLQCLEEQEFCNAGVQPDSSHLYHLAYSEPPDSITPVTKLPQSGSFPPQCGTFLMLGTLALHPLRIAVRAFPSRVQSVLKAVDATETNRSFHLAADR